MAAPETADPPPLRRALDAIYALSGALSASLVAAICLLVTAQVACNILTRLAGLVGLDLSLTIPSYAEFAGYMLAAATFLGLAYTLMRGGHIRVTLLTRAARGPLALALEAFCILVALFLAVAATYYMSGKLHEAWRFGDMSIGIVRFPLWVPLASVVAGLGLLSLALADLLGQTLRARAPVLVSQGEVSAE